MKMLFDFRCKDGHISEALVDKETLEIMCRVCDEPALRVVSPTKFKLEGWSGAFPSRAESWSRDHENAGKRSRERKREEAHYTPSNPYSFF